MIRLTSPLLTRPFLVLVRVDFRSDALVFYQGRDPSSADSRMNILAMIQVLHLSYIMLLFACYLGPIFVQLDIV